MKKLTFVLAFICLQSFALTVNKTGTVEAFEHVFKVDLTKCKEKYHDFKSMTVPKMAAYGFCIVNECDGVPAHLSYERTVKEYREDVSKDSAHVVRIWSGPTTKSNRACHYQITYEAPYGQRANWELALPHLEKLVASLPNGELSVRVLRITP